MNLITLDTETLEDLLEFARYGLEKRETELAGRAKVEDVNERNHRVYLQSQINRGTRALNKAEKKVIFS
jgi:hypothetical protein|tara:strand:+ start:133 stop:339 length:207 start_codon:yes stop_codon:yes gene_type:complete